MLDIMYDLPERSDEDSYVISKDVVEGNETLFAVTEPKSKSA
jgi:ATP-dependent protease Clp ATPase subunit